MAIFDRIFGSEDRGWANLRSSERKIEDGGRFFEDWGTFFEDRRDYSKMEGVLRRRSNLARAPASSKKSPSSIFGSEVRVPYHRSSEAKSEESPNLLFFDLRPRRSKNPHHLRSSASQIGPKIGRQTRVGDFFEDGWFFEGGLVFRSSGSEERRTRPSSIFGAGEEPLHLTPSRPE